MHLHSQSVLNGMKCDGANFTLIYTVPNQCTHHHRQGNQGTTHNKMSKPPAARPFEIVTEGTFARRAAHPNQCSGHLSQCFTPVIPSLGCPFYNGKSTSHSCMTGRNGDEGV